MTTVASLTFLGFLLISAVVFYVFPVKYRWLVLLASSIAFYVIAGSWKFLPFIVLTSLAVWIGAMLIGRMNEKLKAELDAGDLDKAEKKKLKEKYKKKTKTVLILCLLICIGILFFTKFAKYAVFYANKIIEARGGGRTFGIAWIIVPLGISYYTFSTVGYLLDVYWKRYSYEKNFVRFFLYAIYFPHILQGPISRYNLLGQELKKELRFDGDRIISGVQLMIWGFFKKLVIADRLNIFIRAVYDGNGHAGSVFLVTMIFDAIMIYTDFSGYMDIVRGASQIFGVELEPNFNHPFFSKSVSEFWRRWHMSLGSWFKDYVYYPITVSRLMKNVNKKTAKRLPQNVARMISVAIPCLVTWFLTGLWHGTGRTYVLWGIYYGVLITLSVGMQPEFQSLNKKLKIKTESFGWNLFRMIRTFCIFMGGRLLTSPGSINNTKTVVGNIFTNFSVSRLFDDTLLTYGLGYKELYLIVFCIVLLWGVSMMQERFGIREKLAKQNIVIRLAVTVIAVYAVLIFGIYGAGYNAASFVYMQY